MYKIRYKKVRLNLVSFSYIIWSPQGEQPPSVVFNRRYQAEAQAKRLSVAQPNQVFHVCKIKSSTIAGQSAYFGKWRPKKKYPKAVEITRMAMSYEPAPPVAVSEADLISDFQRIHCNDY
jgi:hypothetical protein